MPAAQISSISSLERGWRSMLAILCTSVMDFRSHPRIGITTYSEWSTVIRFEQWELLARAAVCPSQRHTRLLLVVTYLICAVVLIQVGPPREPALPDGASIRGICEPVATSSYLDRYRRVLGLYLERPFRNARH